jgi:dihydroflavonol-4-reductase
MILVTGASGLVGLHLVRALSMNNVKIRALYKTKIPAFLEGTNSNQIEWFQADILDISKLEDAFEGITQVYHCAAIVSYDPRLAETMFDINVEGTANVVNFSVENKIQKLLHISSVASIGKAEEGKMSSEKTEFSDEDSNSNYAKSKYAGEMEVWRGIAEGLNAAIVNPSIILGEGDESKSSTNLFSIVRNEFPYFTKGGTGWVDVNDVVQIMIQLMHSEISNERFILNGENKSFKETFTLMANAMGVKPPHKLASPWMTEIVWRISYLKSKLTGKVATITKETARSAHQTSLYDNSKILKALPNFQFNSIKNTINRIVKNKN